MKYGHFDNVAREYVITRPDTPRSWINYLGSRLYGGIITQNAGGYSFYRTGSAGRILRMRFNGIPADQPGRYIYLRDDETGDYWSATWQPVGKPFDRYEAKVRHGLGYSVFEARYGGIFSTETCFVPRNQAFECWRLQLVNTSNRLRRLSIFSFAEFANSWNYRQDLENLQYSQYTVRMSVDDGMIHWRNATNPGFEEVWFGLCGAEVESWDTDRDLFLGGYRSLANPEAVERGRCGNSIAVGDNACASLHTVIELAPGEGREISFLLGMGAPDESWHGLSPGRQILSEYGDPERLAQELAAIKTAWTEILGTQQVKTPDAGLDTMVNVWNAYQAHRNFVWSRGISLVEVGGRDGLGYRDTVQDMLAVIHAVPDSVEQKLDLMLTGQTQAGGACPLVDPLAHRPGTLVPPGDEAYRSDDTLWLPMTVKNYIAETGKLSYLDRTLPYADRGHASVYGHLKQALQFSLDHKGRNGLIEGLRADWNDCIQFGSTGESLFTTFMFYLGCRIVAELARAKGREDDAAWAEAEAETVLAAIQKSAWDGEWFLRAISATGGTLGSHRNAEGSIYLNAQSWAVLSGAATPEQAELAMESVHKRLATPHGLLLCDPPHEHSDPHIELPLLVYPAGHKENGGIFCHANAWAVVAECLLGHGARALEYYRSCLPARYNEAAELRQVEPYVYCQFTHGRASPRFGQSRNSWLTGAATWSYIAATQYILGIRPTLRGMKVEPCIDPAWEGFLVHRRWRGKLLRIEVQNPCRKSCGVSSLIVNGGRIDGNVIPFEKLGERNEIKAVIDG